MVMKSLLAEIVDGGLILPEEALAMLPAGTPLRVYTDSERGTVRIHAKDPEVMPPDFEQFMDLLDELNEGVSLDEYTKPVPESELRSGKQKNDEGKKPPVSVNDFFAALEKHELFLTGKQLAHLRDLL